MQASQTATKTTRNRRAARTRNLYRCSYASLHVTNPIHQYIPWSHLVSFTNRLESSRQLCKSSTQCRCLCFVSVCLGFWEFSFDRNFCEFDVFAGPIFKRNETVLDNSNKTKQEPNGKAFLYDLRQRQAQRSALRFNMFLLFLLCFLHSAPGPGLSVDYRIVSK